MVVDHASLDRTALLTAPAVSVSIAWEGVRSAAPDVQNLYVPTVAEQGWMRSPAPQGPGLCFVLPLLPLLPCRGLELAVQRM